jgi:hypothetical protein
MKPGTGSSYEFLHRRTAMQPWPDLRPILSGLPWAVVGAVATRAYMPERATQDLDILAHQRNQKEVIKRLEAAGYRRGAPLTISGFTFYAPDGVEVDVIFGNQRWLDEALAQLHQDPAGYPILALPHLVLLKLEASRTQDLGDIARMLGLASAEEIARVRSMINRYTPDAAEDIESLIYLGQLEMQQPPQTSDPTNSEAA